MCKPFWCGFLHLTCSGRTFSEMLAYKSFVCGALGNVATTTLFVFLQPCSSDLFDWHVLPSFIGVSLLTNEQRNYRKDLCCIILLKFSTSTLNVWHILWYSSAFRLGDIGWVTVMRSTIEGGAEINSVGRGMIMTGEMTADEMVGTTSGIETPPLQGILLLLRM